MAQKPVTRYSGSMNDWAEAIKNAGLEKLADKFFENEQIKLAGLKTLLDLGVPTLKDVTVPLKNFLSDPEPYFSQVKSGYYHLTLLSDIEGKRRIRAFPFRKKKVLEYIGKNITETEKDKVTLILKEFHTNIYGGNIIINRDGSLILEIVEGNHIEVVLGTKNIIACGYRSSNSKRIDFYKDHSRSSRLTDADFEQVLRQSIHLIPNFYPGYYEFILVRKGTGGLRPVFIDYRDKEIYQLPTNH